MASAYQVAPVFLIRMAGVPFDVLDRLESSETIKAAREELRKETELSAARSDVATFLQDHAGELRVELFRAWKKAIRWGGIPPPEPATGVFQKYRELTLELVAAQKRTGLTLASELTNARSSLLQSFRQFLPAYLVFSETEMRERLDQQTSLADLPPRNKQARAHERHWLLYLQRVCAKNDSLSEFGPCGWGTTEPQADGIRLMPRPGIATRETFLERWTAHTVAAVVNSDPDTRAEIAPRIHPNCRLDGNSFVFTDTGETLPIDSATADLLRRCDGRTPAYTLGIEPGKLAELAVRNLIRWEIEVTALEPHAYDKLVAEIKRWRDSPVRERWLARLQPLADLPSEFARAHKVAERAQVMDEARRQLEQLGAEQKASTRFLYAATNPIGEECFRDCGTVMSTDLIGDVTEHAAPWIDLWRDNYAFVASRIAAGLRRVFETAASPDKAIPLPAFFRLCESATLPLTSAGLVALATIAFQEVKAAFRERMKIHANQPEYELTPEDCQLVRRQFDYAGFDEYTYPSADLQLAAKSVEAVNAGHYQWILAELHPPVALLHHGFFWACPDPAALCHALAQTTFGIPNFHFGFFAADFTATTAVHLFDLPKDLFYFVSPQKGNPDWNTVRPAEAEVYIDSATGDVCLRKIDNRQYLGSFARNWLIPLGFHPFTFSLGEHTPRLRCGKVVVQRRSWTVRQEELGAGNFSGVSRDLVLAIERLRARKDWPRYIYIRPTEQVLRRSGAEGRDKDTKPVFIDLESYLFMEIFHRWLTKAGELEITEMLPAPDDLLWRESDGRRTFEIRTQIIPRA